MKIAKKELEKIILEELEASLDEGIFSQVGAGLKGAASQIRGAAKDVGGAVKQAAGKVAGAYQTGKAAQKEKEKASSSQQAILRIAAEVLANPQASGVDQTETETLWKAMEHYTKSDAPPPGTLSRFSPAALVREEDNIEEATEREIRTELSLLQKAIKDGVVTFDGIKADLEKLVKKNDVVKAIPGALELLSQKEPGSATSLTPPVAAPQAQPAGKPAAAQAGTVKNLDKQLEVISDFLQFFRSDPEINNLIKNTKIGSLLGLREQQYQSQLLQLLKSNEIGQEEVQEFLNAVSSNSNAQQFFSTMGVKLPEQPVQQSQPAPETSVEPVATQGPPESPKSGDAPQPVASGEEAMRKAKKEATGAISASTIGDIFRDAARKIEALTDIDDKTKEEISDKVYRLATNRKITKPVADQMSAYIDNLKENKELKRLKELAGILKD